MFDPSDTLRDLEALARRAEEAAARGANESLETTQEAYETIRETAQEIIDRAAGASGEAIETIRETAQEILDFVEVGKDGKCNLVIRIGNNVTTIRIPGCEEDPEPIQPLPPLDPPDPPPKPPDWPGGRPPNGTYVEIVLAGSSYFDDPAESVECIHQFWAESKLAELTGDLIAPTRVNEFYKTVDRGFAFALYTPDSRSWDGWRFQGYLRNDSWTAPEGAVTANRWGNTDFIQRFDPQSDRPLFVRWKINAPDGLKYLVSPDTRWSTPRRLMTYNGLGHQFWLIQQFSYPSIELSVSYQAAAISRLRGLVEELDAALTASYPPKILGVYSGRAPYPYDGDGIGCHPAPIPPTKKPPPPPPRKKPDMDKCDDRLLRFLLAKVERIEKTLAAPQFFDIKGDRDTGKVKPKMPMDLPRAPERLVYPKKRGDKAQMAIPNLLTLGEFLIRQIDRAMGAFPLKVKISDGEKTEKGNQPVEVEINSVADGLREIVEVGIESGSNVEVVQLLQHRNLLETGIVHHANVKMEAMIRAIVEYLDFKVNYKIRQFPFYFDPTAGVQRGKGFGMWVLNEETMEPEEQIPEAPDTNGELEKILPLLLKENMQKIKVMEWDRKEKRSQNDKIEEILRNVIIAANAVGVEATPEKLEDLIKHTRVLVKLQNVQQQSNVQAAMTSGKLTRRKQ